MLPSAPRDAERQRAFAGLLSLLGHCPWQSSSCVVTRRKQGFAFAIRPCPRDSVAKAGCKPARVRFRSDGDAVRACGHALASLGLGWYVMVGSYELSELDEVPDFPEVPAIILEAGAWSVVASHPWKELNISLCLWRVLYAVRHFL